MITDLALEEEILDLFGQTLKQLFDCIESCGASYTREHPVQVHIRRNDDCFILHSLDQLLDLFDFIEVKPIPIPDWLDLPGTYTLVH